MAARFVQVTIVNNSNYPLRWLDDNRPHGFWQDPWYPSKITDLKKGEQATFRQESGGVMTGVEVPRVPNTPDQSETMHLWWERPYIGAFDKKAALEIPPQPNNPSHQAYVKINDHGYCGDLGGGETFTAAAVLLGEAFFPQWIPIGQVAGREGGLRIWWLVEIVNNDLRTAQPPPQQDRIAPSVIYAIKDNGDLIWSRHSGHEDGTFKWADGSGKKVGNGWDFKQVFSGGDGIIYAIQKTTIDMTTGRREGGALAWYRHDDWENGCPR